MDQKKVLLFVGAGVIALGTVLGLKVMLSHRGAVAQAMPAIVAPKGPRVLVAQRALPVGTIITADAISFQAWPKDMVRDAYFLDDSSFSMNKLIGTVVRYPVTAGQPLTQGALVAPGDRGFLAAALTPGMRAITIPVSDKSSVAGFVFPGDHVDLMLTQKVAPTVAGTGVDTTPLNVTETILRNLRVLATDQSPVSDKTPDGKTEVHTFHTVTLEVTPRIAEKIEVAQSIGAIDMTLRAIADSQCELDKAIATGTVNVIGKPGAAPAPGMAAAPQLLNKTNYRPTEGESSFSTGGDVSRFQRRTLPAGAKAAVRAYSAPVVKVVRGNAVSGGNDGSALAGALSNMMTTMANGAGNAGRTTAATTPAAVAGGI